MSCLHQELTHVPAKALVIVPAAAGAVTGQLLVQGLELGFVLRRVHIQALMEAEGRPEGPELLLGQFTGLEIGAGGELQQVVVLVVLVQIDEPDAGGAATLRFGRG